VAIFLVLPTRWSKEKLCQSPPLHQNIIWIYRHTFFERDISRGTMGVSEACSATTIQASQFICFISHEQFLSWYAWPIFPRVLWQNPTEKEKSGGSISDPCTRADHPTVAGSTADRSGTRSASENDHAIRVIIICWLLLLGFRSIAYMCRSGRRATSQALMEVALVAARLDLQSSWQMCAAAAAARSVAFGFVPIVRIRWRCRCAQGPDPLSGSGTSYFEIVSLIMNFHY
jgi:hypothetical protein